MNRRELLQCTAAVAAVSALPVSLPPVEAAPASPLPLRWFVAGDDERVYPYLARTAEEALRKHVWVGAGPTVGDACPVCDEPDCTEHNDDLDAPAPHLEAYAVPEWRDLPTNKEPVGADWVRGGFYTPCDTCDYDEPTECFVFQGQALCCECLEAARDEAVGALVGMFTGPCECGRWKHESF